MSVATEETYLSKMGAIKPKKSSKELVLKMIDKGIDISPYSIDEVESYLLNSNNFFRVCSYRKNYQKYLNGDNKGKYIGLSFDRLKALAIFDMKFRKSVLGICLDVEHSLKLYILRDFENSSDDGYMIIQDFFKTKNGNKAVKNIVQKSKNIYVSDLTNKYIYSKETEQVFFTTDPDNKEVNVDLPVWAMLELLTFGDLLNFYYYYFNLKNKKPPIPNGVLHKVKNIRNACAHNNCVLNNLYDDSANIPSVIGEFAKQLGLSKSSINKKLKCNAICEMMCTFYCLDALASLPIRKHDYDSFSTEIDRFFDKYYHLFEKDLLVKSYLDFIKQTVDKLKEICYNTIVA